MKKLRIGWFSFSCCEDSTVMFTELLNDHYKEWLPLLDIRHARVLQSKNVLDELDVAFVEGAIAAPDHEEKLKEIRAKSKKLVAIGSCAVAGNFSTQRNEFPEEVQDKIHFLLEKFHYGKRAKRLDEIVQVDEKVNGCPMDNNQFIAVLTKMLQEFNIVPAKAP